MLRLSWVGVGLLCALLSLRCAGAAGTADWARTQTVAPGTTLPADAPLFRIAGPPLLPGIRTAVAVAAGPQRTLFVVDAFHRTVSRQAASGRLLDRWPVAPDLGGHRDVPVDLDVGPDGSVWALDSDAEIRVYRPEGGLRASWSLDAEATSLALLPDGDVWVTGRDGPVYHFAANGTLRRTLRLGLSSPAGIDVHPELGVAIVDGEEDRIVWVGLDGRPISGRPNGAAVWPAGLRAKDVAIATDGRVAVGFVDAGAPLLVGEPDAPLAPLDCVVCEVERLTFDGAGRLFVAARDQVFVQGEGDAPLPWAHARPFLPTHLVDLEVAPEGYIDVLGRDGLARFDRHGARLAAWSPRDRNSSLAAMLVTERFERLSLRPDGSR